MADPFEALKDKYMRPAPGFLFHPQVGSVCESIGNYYCTICVVKAEKDQIKYKCDNARCLPSVSWRKR